MTMTLDHTMTQGDSAALDFTITDAAGSAVDLTGATVKWQASRARRRAPLVEKATGGSGVTVTDAAGGLFTVDLDPDDTADISGVLYHEAEVTDASGNVSTVRTGYLRVLKGLID